MGSLADARTGAKNMAVARHFRFCAFTKSSWTLTGAESQIPRARPEKADSGEDSKAARIMISPSIHAERFCQNPGADFGVQLAIDKRVLQH
jgi:hypothetical protein